MTGTIFLGATEYSVGEAEGSVTISIERTGDNSGAVDVLYSTNADTAVDGADFTGSSGTITIPAGADRAQLTIPVLDDAASEATERFNVSLIDVTSGTLLFPRTANINILDDENPVTDPVDPPLQSDFDVTIEPVVSGFSQPLNIEWLPGAGNQALVIEKGGRINLVDMDTGDSSVFLDIRDKVNAAGDRGLMDIALHPDFAGNNPYLYAFYVVDPAEAVNESGNAGRDGQGNRFAHVVRFEVDTTGNTPEIVSGSETILVGAGGQSLSDISGGGALDFTEQQYRNNLASDVDPVTGDYVQDYIKVDSLSHAGGALAFGPDGALYVSIGDGASFNYDDPRTVSVQSVDALSGKILRIDPMTGAGLADNPYVQPGDDLDANSSKVWQMGLRNPYVMAFSDDGKLFISETGWFSWEEINNGEAGANFGWPFYEGGDSGQLEQTPIYNGTQAATDFYQLVAAGDIEITAPYRAFSHSEGDPGYSMSAIVGSSSVYDGSQYPSVFTDDLFVVDIVDGDVFAVDVNDRTQLQYITTFPASQGIVNFAQGPDGLLYYVDFTGSVGRLLITDPNAGPNGAPFVANAVDPVEAVVGQALDFALPQGTFFDPDGDALSFTATLSDGSPLPSWLSFNAQTGQLTGTPGNGDLGSLAVRIIADDGNGGTAQDVFQLNVVSSAVAPLLAIPADNQTTPEEAAFSYTLPAGMFTDDDALVLSATLTNGDPLPAWLAFDAGTGTFTGTPDDPQIGSIAVTVTATDPTGRSASDSFSITVAPVNDAPTVANPLADQSGEAESAINFQVPANSFADVDDPVLTLTAALANGDPLPAWLVFDPGAGTFTGTPPASAAGQILIAVTATDAAGANVSDEFALTIDPPPQGSPFVGNPIANQTATEEALFDFTVPEDTFSDPENDPLTYSASLANGDPLPSWLSFDPATRAFSGTPDDPDIATLQIAVRAVDPAGASATDVFELTVDPVNDAPTIAAPLSDQTGRAETTIGFTVPADSFADVDDAALTLTATLANGDPLPAWLVFDPATGSFAGTPPAGAVGQIDIEVTASDAAGANVSDEFALTITPANAAPVTANPLADQNATEEALFDFSVPEDTFSDPENDPLTYSASLANGDPLPSWLSFDPATRAFSGTPDDADLATLEVAVTATDPSGASATDIFELTVDPVNDAPIVASPLADQQSEAGTALDFSLPANSFTDVDDTTLTLTAALASGDPLPAWLVFDPATGSFTGTPPAGAVGQIDIEVTATDAAGANVSDEFALTITAPNGAPVTANPLADQSATEEALFDFTVPADTFNDPENDALTYSASLANGDPLPSWLSFDPATRAFLGTPDDADLATLEVAVTVTDPLGASATDIFELTVDPVNDAPIVASPLADQQGEVGTALDFAVPAGTFTDADDTSLVLSASLAGGDPLPGWLAFDPASGTFSGTPPVGSDGDITVAVSASDDEGASITDEFVLTIGAPPSPENEVLDTPNVVQFLNGTTDNDIFVIDGNAENYGWGPTEDGLGVVVWGPTGHDLLYGFEAIRFNDFTAPLTVEDARYEDIPGLTQYITGTTSNDTFVINGNSTDYNWGPTESGEGVVIWANNRHDILYEFEAIEFNDRTVSLVDEV